MSLEGKVCIVTGAARGIGKAIAKELASQGGDIIIADINGKQAKETFEEIKAQYKSNRGFHFAMDVSKNADVERMVRTVKERLGGIHVLVNNVGINPLGATPVIDFPEEIFDKIMAVNFKSVFLCSKAVGKIMIEQRCGRIINIGSWWGKKGYPLFATYSAAKAAIICFTQALAVELIPYNITVNCVCPGYVDTEMHKISAKEEAEKRCISYEEMVEWESSTIPIKRFAQPEEIAKLVAYLTSPEAEYIVGQAININGGLVFH